MSPNLWSRSGALAVACAAMFILACSENGVTSIDVSPLAGMQQAGTSDSAGNEAPPPANPSSPGYVRGTVLGPSEPGAGNDSLNTAPRIAGVKVTAYRRVAPSAADTIGIGPAAATVTTGADGKFELPTVPGGEYWVTFDPPANSLYGGVWVTGPIHDKSHEHPWWIILWKKP